MCNSHTDPDGKVGLFTFLKIIWDALDDGASDWTELTGGLMIGVTRVGLTVFTELFTKSEGSTLSWQKQSKKLLQICLNPVENWQIFKIVAKINITDPLGTR